MIQVRFPKPVEDELRRAFGARLDDEVRVAVVAEGFRLAQLSIGQVARLLDLSIDQANRLMLDRGVQQSGPTLEDIEREAAELNERLSRERGS
jgi:predicted HTH domain antitoxin